MFEWKRKQLEDEQIKFFGGERKKFVSCYARKEKPRVKIKNKSLVSDLNVISQQHGLQQLYAAGLVNSNYYAQQQTALTNSLAENNIRAAQASQLLFGKGDCGIYGSLGSALGGFAGGNGQGQLRQG